MKNEIKNFYDLISWRIALKLTIEVYRITNNFPRREMYNIVDQTRRASCSITANIAEGFERYYFKDKIRFYYQARGSAGEVENFIILAKELNIVEVDKYLPILNLTRETKKTINGLIRLTEKFHNKSTNY